MPKFISKLITWAKLRICSSYRNNAVNCCWWTFSGCAHTYLMYGFLYHDRYPRLEARCAPWPAPCPGLYPNPSGVLKANSNWKACWASTSATPVRLLKGWLLNPWCKQQPHWYQRIARVWLLEWSSPQTEQDTVCLQSRVQMEKKSKLDWRRMIRSTPEGEWLLWKETLEVVNTRKQTTLD